MLIIRRTNNNMNRRSFSPYCNRVKSWETIIIYLNVLLFKFHLNFCIYFIFKSSNIKSNQKILYLVLAKYTFQLILITKNYFKYRNFIVIYKIYFSKLIDKIPKRKFKYIIKTRVEWDSFLNMPLFLFLVN